MTLRRSLVLSGSVQLINFLNFDVNCFEKWSAGCILPIFSDSGRSETSVRDGIRWWGLWSMRKLLMRLMLNSMCER